MNQRQRERERERERERRERHGGERQRAKEGVWSGFISAVSHLRYPRRVIINPKAKCGHGYVQFEQCGHVAPDDGGDCLAMGFCPACTTSSKQFAALLPSISATRFVFSFTAFKPFMPLLDLSTIAWAYLPATPASPSDPIRTFGSGLGA